jgi:hypothetical protein
MGRPRDGQGQRPGRPSKLERPRGSGTSDASAPVQAPAKLEASAKGTSAAPFTTTKLAGPAGRSKHHQRLGGGRRPTFGATTCPEGRTLAGPLVGSGDSKVRLERNLALPVRGSASFRLVPPRSASFRGRFGVRGRRVAGRPTVLPRSAALTGASAGGWLTWPPAPP